MPELNNNVVTVNNTIYSLLYKLGKGVQGSVYCCKNIISKQYYAIKILPYTPYALNQIKVLQSCQSPNIIKMYDCQTKKDKVYILLELGELTLSDYLQNKPEKTLNQYQLFNFIKDISNGLICIHNKNFVHHDLNLENIILNVQTFKISDFGLTTINKAVPQQGTPLYMAPQLLGQAPVLNPHKIDIWSFGVITFICFYRIHPFGFDYIKADFKQYKKQIEKICSGGYNIFILINWLKQNNRVSESNYLQSKYQQTTNKQLIDQFFRSIFVINPQQRATLQNLKIIMQNKGGFVNQINNPYETLISNQTMIPNQTYISNSSFPSAQTLSLASSMHFQPANSMMIPTITSQQQNNTHFYDRPNQYITPDIQNLNKGGYPIEYAKCLKYFQFCVDFLSLKINKLSKQKKYDGLGNILTGGRKNFQQSDPMVLASNAGIFIQDKRVMYGSPISVSADQRMKLYSQIFNIVVRRQTQDLSLHAMLRVLLYLPQIINKIKNNPNHNLDLQCKNIAQSARMSDQIQYLQSLIIKLTQFNLV